MKTTSDQENGQNLIRTALRSSDKRAIAATSCSERDNQLLVFAFQTTLTRIEFTTEDIEKLH